MWPYGGSQIMPWPLELFSFVALSPGFLLILNPKAPPLLLDGRAFWPISLSLGNGVLSKYYNKSLNTSMSLISNSKGIQLQHMTGQLAEGLTNIIP
jgi:hypothetical protein